MQNAIEEVHMQSLAGKATLVLALSASAMSLVSAWVVPLGRIWPSLAWAVVACVGGLWALQLMTGQARTMGRVIAGVEAEPPPPGLAPAPSLGRRGARS